MKSNFFLFFLIVFFYSCDSDKKDIFNLENVKIEATLNNNNSSINLGDTIKISVLLPDVLSGSSGAVNVQSLQKAQFYMQLNKIDTVNNKTILQQQPTYWTTKGNISPSNVFNFEFSKDVKPFGVQINFKPQEKGIYYLEIVSQSGQLLVNNYYEARIIVNFNVPDKHINIATPFFGTTWTNEALTREYGSYIFRVN